MGIAGWSGSGKTTLIERMLPVLRARGLRVSTLKRTHHDVDLDQPGKDSFRHRAAGAEEVMVVSSRRFALMRELDGEPSLPALVARMAPVDLVLAEGFKFDAVDKIEVHRPSRGKPPLWPDDPGIVAIATDGVLSPAPPVPCLDLNDPGAVACWIAGHGGA